MKIGFPGQSNHQQRWVADRSVVSHAGLFSQYQERLRKTMIAVGAVSSLAILAGATAFVAGSFSGEPDAATAQAPERPAETLVASLDAETPLAAEPAEPEERARAAKPRLKAERVAPAQAQQAMRAAEIPAAAAESARLAVSGGSTETDAAEVLLDPQMDKTAASFEQPVTSDPHRTSSADNGPNGNQQSIDTANETSMDADAGLTGSTSLSRTGSISPEPPVEIAQSEEEIAALEDAMAKESPDAFVAAVPEDDATDPAAAPEEEVQKAAAPKKAGAAVPASSAVKDLQTAWANSDVNMRASGDSEAAVVAVVPNGAEIAADPSCKHWCEVVYKGSRGFIYQSFIRRP